MPPPHNNCTMERNLWTQPTFLFFQTCFDDSFFPLQRCFLLNVFTAFNCLG